MKKNGNTKEENINKVSILGIILNLSLLIIKSIVGFFSKSQAMMADALNSAGDIFASLMSFIGGKLSSKPSDSDHPYGHGKAEYIFSFIISISMIIASIFMIRSSFGSILQKKEVEYSPFLIITCLVTVIVKLILYLYSKGKYNKTNSILIKASMEDHRNDIFVTFGTFIGVIASIFSLYFVDGLIGMFISLWIIVVAMRLLKESYIVLMDTGLDEITYNNIIEIIEQDERIMHVDEILSKPIGNKYIIILKVSMDGDISLEKSHNIGGQIKEKLIDRFDFISDVIIHINPHNI